MNRRAMGIVAAVVLGAVGTFVLVAYVRDAKDSAVADERLVPVIVASREIPAGTPAEDLGRMTKSERVPAKVRAGGAVTKLKGLRGLVTATDLVRGEELLRARFSTPERVTKGVGEVKVPVGFVEITLSLEPQRAVGGL